MRAVPHPVRSRLARLLPGPQGLLWGAAAVVLGGAVVERLRDEDMWWHLATGRTIAATGTPPTIDPFAVGEVAKPWVAHEWLYELLLYLVHEAGGQPLLVLVPVALAIATAAVLARECAARQVPATFGAPALVLALLPTHEFWVQRPHAVSYLFLALLLSDLSAHADGRRRSLLRWVPLMVLWANLHAASVIAPVILGAYVAGTILELPRAADARPRLRHLLFVLPLVVAAGLVNPQGPGLYVHALGYTSYGWQGMVIVEWLPPDLRDPRRLAFAVVAVGTLVAAGLSRKARPGELFALAGLLLMALRHQRHVPLALLAAAPVLAASVPQALGELLGKSFAPREAKEPRTALGVAHLVTLAGMALGFVLVRWPCDRGLCEEPERFPRAAIAALEAGGDPPGRPLNHYDWGGYLLWTRPGKPVYVDGRTTDIDLERIASYMDAHEVGPGLDATLARDAIGWVLYPPGEALVAALRERGWTERHADPTAVVLVPPRGAPPGASVRDEP